MDDNRLVFDQSASGAGDLVFGAGESPPDLPPVFGTPLVFSQPPVATPGPVRLVFGDDGTAPANPDVTLSGGGRITGAHVAHIATQAGVALAAAGRITGPRIARIATTFDINVSRPTVGGAHTAWQDAAPVQFATRTGWQQSDTMPAGTRTQWQDAERAAAALLARWSDTDKRNTAAAVRYEEARRVPADPVRGRFQETERRTSAAATRFQEAVRLPGAPLVGRFQETYRDRQARVGSIFQVADKLAVQIASGMGIAVRLPLGFGGRFQEAWPPRPGQWQRPGPPLSEPCYLPVLPAHLIFTDPNDTTLPVRLTFVCETGPVVTPEPGATVVVPTLRVYIVINDASLRRVDGNVPIPTFSMSMSLDTDSWAWGFNADVPRSALNALQPSSFGDPVELEALVNGVPYRFLAEQLSTSRTFGRESLRIGGRGLTATLDAPYAPSLNFGNASARTAQQLMGDVLTINGVGLGWSVDWQLTDWLVPGNVWSLQGSYVDALNSIVQSAGGYLQPHAVDKTVKALRRYPTAPWDWGTTAIDVELPADVTTQEGIAWKDNPRYNRVFVSGTAGGVLGQVTRAGTDGALIAPMVTDSLITHADAARQRGISVLATSGRQAMVNLQLPVLASTGIITPGKMVRYVDGATSRVGITRSVQVDVRMPEISQQIEVETYA